MKRGWVLVTVIFLIIGACACILFAGMYGLGFYLENSNDYGSLFGNSGPPASTPVILRPTSEPESSHKAAEQKIVSGNDTLSALMNSETPANDIRDIAARLEGKKNIPLTVAPLINPFELGSQQNFWVSNVDSNEYFQVSMSLEYITDHVYFWVQEGIHFDPEDVRQLAEIFENKIYPTTRAFFGSEWSPGVDGDPHLYILYAKDLGSILAGYFATADEQHPLAYEYSNAHESFVLNSDIVNLKNEFAYSVLAHEFQHMIHWNIDRDEASWVNEGLSELAVYLNGYQVGSEFNYIVKPDIQLNHWPNDQRQTFPHYGASFLFLTYFMDRFGVEAMKSFVENPANGLEGIDQVLDEIDAKDGIFGGKIFAEDVFLDWVIASFLKDDRVADGRYTYYNYPEVPQADETETVNQCQSNSMARDVHQFGVDYIRIKCKGNFLLKFEGSTLAKITPTDPYSGKYYFWSNIGDESDMTLTKHFDFRDYDGPLTLTYWTWYDLEQDYDYAYIEVSEDGESWDILVTPSGTPEDPSGNSHGWGYNGKSEGWIQESVDLSDYAGMEVQIRFEYITDAAVNNEGMLIDDIAIPEIGYFTGFEQDSDGWEARGWVRIDNQIPQTYRLALIKYSDEIEVDYIHLAEDGRAEIELNLDEGTEEVVLVVTGTSRYTRQKAAYRIEINSQ
jgi:immune inhibitor A